MWTEWALNTKLSLFILMKNLSAAILIYSLFKCEFVKTMYLCILWRYFKVLIFPENEPSYNNCPLLANFGQKKILSAQKFLISFRSVDFYENINKITIEVLKKI